MLGARFYHELIGRFISVDPIMDLTDPQQWHGYAYAYANSNPVTWTDSTGFKPHVAHARAPGGHTSQRSVFERLTTAVKTLRANGPTAWVEWPLGRGHSARASRACCRWCRGTTSRKGPQAIWGASATGPLDNWRGVRRYDDAKMMVGNELYTGYTQPS